MEGGLTKTDDRRLTMDPNTVGKRILLSEGNRRARRTHEPQTYPDHLERFNNSLEVLCEESLTGRCYWEVETGRYNAVGVAYGSIDRKEARGLRGRRSSDKLWFCEIHPVEAGSRFTFYHNREEDTVFVPGPRPPLYRLRVYLDWPAGRLSFYQVSADDDTRTHLHTYNTTFTEPLYPWFYILDEEVTLCRVYQSNSWTSFTPDVSTVSTSTVYKSRLPSAGVFECDSTGLVFGVEGEREVQYETVQWDESLLQSAGMTPAGPLFRIQCPQGSVSQLQLPHCLTSAALSCDYLSLAVVHITDDGLMTILKPLRITRTHVVVNVPHLSVIGLTWRLLEGMFPSLRSMSSLILLLVRPPRPEHQVLDVFLLPSNVLYKDVYAQHEDSKRITTSASCDLTRGQDYSLECVPEYKRQPKSGQFRLNYGPNYVPTFEVRTDPNAREVGLTIRDPRDGCAVWSRDVDLPGGQAAVAGGEPTAIAGWNYKMDSSPLGVCVIINNLFEKETNPRKGTEKDAEDLTKVFSWLGFKVLKCEEKTKKDMSDILELVSKLDPLKKGRKERRGDESLNALRKHTLKEWDGGKFVKLKDLPRHGDAFVCCILSHGNKDGVFGVDGQILPNNEIYLPFYGTTCPALAGKPKIFIIQACRGSDGMKQASVEADDLSIFLHSYKPDVFETEPDGANFLIARAIVEGFVSFRTVDPILPSYGSWFIQTLCDQLKKGCPRGDDVYKILQEVNRQTGLKRTYWVNPKQITPQLTTQAPEFTSTMTKALVFPPPSAPPPL